MNTLALGGGTLEGDKLVRFVYLDESGIGNIEHDPFVVTAGVIVHADSQWKALEQRLRELVDDFIRPEDRHGFCFHATDLYHGSKNTPRKLYPDKEKRRDVLFEICSLIQQFNLPVVFGAVSRTAAYVPGTNLKEKTLSAQVMSAIDCALSVEYYMREKAGDGEVATMVYENNNASRAHIKHLHRLLQNPRLEAQMEAVNSKLWKPRPLTNYLPFRHIVDTCHFAEKKDTSILQIADACVFALKRKLMKQEDADRYVEPIEKQLIFKTKMF